MKNKDDQLLHKVVHFYCRTVLLLLITTVVLKLFLVLSERASLGLENPFFRFLSNRQVFFFAIVAESMVSYVLISRTHSLLMKCLTVMWLSLVFFAYRVFLWISGASAACSCLGVLPGWIGLPTRLNNEASLAILGFMFFGSLFGVMVLFVMRRRWPLRNSIVSVDYGA